LIGRSLLSLGLVLMLALAFACDDDDDANGSPTTDTGTPATGGTADTPADGANGGDVEQQFEALQQRFNEASQETQDELAALWEQVEGVYQQWQDASEDERDAIASQFESLMEQLETGLDDAAE
jgi:uncharacterized protein YukE